MNKNETSAQRAARRYGPLAGLVAVILVVGVLVARADKPITTAAGAGATGAAPAAPGTALVDDGKRPISGRVRARVGALRGR